MISATSESSESPPERLSGDSIGEERDCLLSQPRSREIPLILIGRILVAVFLVVFALICCFVIAQIYFDKRFQDDVTFAEEWTLTAATEREMLEAQQAQLTNRMIEMKKSIELQSAKEIELEMDQQKMQEMIKNDRVKVEKLESDLDAGIAENKEQIVDLEGRFKYALAEATCHQNGGQTFAGKCYTIFWKECYSKTFQQAKNFCKKQNQTLVYPSNLGELHFLTQFLWAFQGCPHIGFVKCKNILDRFYSVDGKVTINATSPLWDQGFPRTDIKGRYACLAIDNMKLQNQCNGLHEFACFYKLLSRGN